MVLFFVGVPTFYITAVLALLGVLSWIALLMTFYRRARELGGQARNLASIFYQVRRVKLAAATATTLMAVIFQIIVVKLSYVLSGNFGASTDKEARTFMSAFAQPPSHFLNTRFLESLTHVNAVSIAWVTLAMAAVASTYMSRQGIVMRIIFGGIPIGATFIILLVGSILLLGDTLLTVLSTIGRSQDLGAAGDEEPYVWDMTTDFLLAPPFVTIATVAIIYSIVIILAYVAGRKARQIWLEIFSTPRNVAEVV